MIVTVGGKHYEIGEIGYGGNPVWRFVKRDGRPMTAAEFQSLPAAEKHELAAHVHRQIEHLNETRR
jgi:hypothetical protein